MLTYKLIQWDDVKAFHRPRSGKVLAMESLTVIPFCVIYYTVVGEYDQVYFVIRIRYALRLIRLYLQLRIMNRDVGNPTIYAVFLGIGIFLSVYIVIMAMVVYILLANDGQENENFFNVLYDSFTKVCGCGIPLRNVAPYQGLFILIIFALICYSLFVYYTSAFISAILLTLKAQYRIIPFLHRDLGRVANWKYHSYQMTTAVSIIFRAKDSN